MGSNLPNPGTEKASETGADQKKTTPPEGVEQGKEKEKATKEIGMLLGEGIAKDLTHGLKAYGQFIEALEKLGAVDLLDMIKKGFNVWQIEGKIKKQLEEHLIPSSEISKLSTNVSQMGDVKPGEKAGDYVLRCLGLTKNYLNIPKRNDGKGNDPTMISMIWLKTSGVMNLLASNAVRDGLKPNPETKKPILCANDLVYIKISDKEYTAGFIKDFDLENDKIILSTIENGSHVIKDFKFEDVLIAFHLAGNTNILDKSNSLLPQEKKDEAKKDEKKDDKKPDQGSKPA